MCYFFIFAFKKKNWINLTRSLATTRFIIASANELGVNSGIFAAAARSMASRCLDVSDPFFNAIALLLQYFKNSPWWQVMRWRRRVLEPFPTAYPKTLLELQMCKKLSQHNIKNQIDLRTKLAKIFCPRLGKEWPDIIGAPSGLAFNNIRWEYCMPHGRETSALWGNHLKVDRTRISCGGGLTRSLRLWQPRGSLLVSCLNESCREEDYRRIRSQKRTCRCGRRAAGRKCWCWSDSWSDWWR